MQTDNEIDAMKMIAGQLEALDDAQRARVLAWAWDRFGDGGGHRLPGPNELGSTAQAQELDFPNLYHAADPQRENDRALVAGYWLQIHQGESDFDAQSANDLLKNMGYPIGNITRSLTRLQEVSPAFVRQTQKSGRSKQARKRYRVTTEGVRAVEARLQGRDLTNRDES